MPVPPYVPPSVPPSVRPSVVRFSSNILLIDVNRPTPPPHHARIFAGGPQREREETKEKLIGINTIRCEGEEEEEPLAVCVCLLDSHFADADAEPNPNISFAIYKTTAQLLNLAAHGGSHWT